MTSNPLVGCVDWYWISTHRRDELKGKEIHDEDARTDGDGRGDSVVQTMLAICRNYWREDVWDRNGRLALFDGLPADVFRHAIEHCDGANFSILASLGIAASTLPSPLSSGENILVM